jgi:hypothetical protein
MGNLKIKPATRMDCAPYILGIHYAKRFPSVSYAFALYRDGVIVGVVTYGTPASSPLRKGIAGKENAHRVLELNRLCLRDNLKNEASQLIAGSIKMLPARKIIISFADTEQGHRGIVYQACNFTYHGLSAKRTDWKVKGKEHLHGQTIADEFRGVKNRAAAMRQKYGDDFYLKPRARKHKYIFLHGPKLWKKRMSKNIRYPEQGLIKPTI